MQLDNITKEISLLKPSRVIVELGMGDGQLLENLAKCDANTHSIYIGIELDKQQYEDALSELDTYMATL